jgi:hypothetical protein
LAAEARVAAEPAADGSSIEVNMTNEQLVQELLQAAGSNLKSIILYGSATAGDFVPDVSRNDILIIADHLDSPSLNALGEPIRRWQKAGNPVPQLLTMQELLSSVDVFAIEILDMQQSRRVLFGSDPFADIKVDMSDYRAQLERELKTRHLLLRRKYIAVSRDENSVANLMIASLSTFLVLLRAALRLYNNAVPADKAEAVSKLTDYVNFNPEPFRDVLALKQRAQKPIVGAIQPLFTRYLSEIEKVVDAVDRLPQTSTNRVQP